MQNVLSMQNISKSFPGIKANDDISIELRKSEVHAILGENGAGKSTLMNILFGIYQQDIGEIEINNKKVSIKGPNHAYKLGIGMVHQHFKLVKTFTVIENIILGIEELKHGMVDVSDSRRKIIELSKKYKLEVDPDELVSNITVGMQQRVEILKMLYREADIMIFDEPTAVLTPQQITDLIGIIKMFTKEGKSVIIITHKIDEIISVADRCTVLKSGRHIGTVDVKNTTKEELSKMMVGREVDFSIDKIKATVGRKVLQVEKLNLHRKGSKKNLLVDISFHVSAGEIVSIAGIDGNGQSELIQSITGLVKSSSGIVKLLDNDISKMSIRNKTLSGISFIPEDRHKHGLVLDFSLEENLILQDYFKEKYQKKGFLLFEKIRQNAIELIKKFDIRSGRGGKTTMRSLSGGNQQKAILAREIQRESDLLIAVQPTRGLDAGAIEYIHKKLIEERDNGRAVLVSSLELDEIMNISDRILVMFEGEIVGRLNPSETTFEEVGLYMSGSKRD